MAREKVINVGFIFIGGIIGFLLILVHELLHAIAFPKYATVYIGIMPRSLTAVALSSSPVKRNRFIFLSILPIILGLIPLVIFCVSSNYLKEINGINNYWIFTAKKLQCKRSIVSCCRSSIYEKQLTSLSQE